MSVSPSSGLLFTDGIFYGLLLRLCLQTKYFDLIILCDSPSFLSNLKTIRYTLQFFLLELVFTHSEVLVI